MKTKLTDTQKHHITLLLDWMCKSKIENKLWNGTSDTRWAIDKCITELNFIKSKEEYTTTEKLLLNQIIQFYNDNRISIEHTNTFAIRLFSKKVIDIDLL